MQCQLQLTVYCQRCTLVPVRWGGVPDSLGGLDSIGDHARHCQGHASQLPLADCVPEEGPATNQHQDGLAVPQNLHATASKPAA